MERKTNLSFRLLYDLTVERMEMRVKKKKKSLQKERKGNMACCSLLQGEHI